MDRVFNKHYMKSLMPKGAKSIFDQNRVTDITTLFSLPPTFKTHFWSKLTCKKKILLIQYWVSHRRVYKLAQRNAFFSEVTKVDLTPFGIKLFIYMKEEMLYLPVVLGSWKLQFDKRAKFYWTWRQMQWRNQGKAASCTPETRIFTLCIYMNIYIKI